MSSNDIKVTIGMCVKNSESTVKEALQSTLSQDVPNVFFELLIVDGYSRDNTLKIVKTFLRKTDIQSKIFLENKGLPHARQMIVDNARGKYIVWVDGDMILTKDFIKSQFEFMEKNPLVGIAKGKYSSFGRETHHENIVAALENVEFLLNTMYEGATNSKALGTSGCIYRTIAIREIGGFDLELIGVGEDMDVENRIRNAGWLLHVTSAPFYETRRESWRLLWNEYFWHGCGGRRLFEKDWQLFDFYKMIPPVAIIAEFLRIPSAYKLTRQRIVLLLPLHYTFKRIAWFSGFIKSGFEKN